MRVCFSNRREIFHKITIFRVLIKLTHSQKLPPQGHLSAASLAPIRVHTHIKCLCALGTHQRAIINHTTREKWHNSLWRRQQHRPHSHYKSVILNETNKRTNEKRKKSQPQAENHNATSNNTNNWEKSRRCHRLRRQRHPHQCNYD